MRNWRGVLVGLAVGTLAVTAWLWRGTPDVTPTDGGHASPTGDTDATPAAANTNAAPPDDGTSRTPGTVVADPTTLPEATFHEGLRLRVRLRGAHPAVPWRSPLRLTIYGLDGAHRQWREFDAAATPDDRGEVVFALPDWYGSAMSHEGRVFGHDDNYREVNDRWRAAIDFTRVREIDVQVIAMLDGSVFDSARQPVGSARVTAFVMREGAPSGAEIARNTTSENGRWTLRVPPDVPVFVLATPMLPSIGRYSEHRGDNGAMRADLLPTSVVTRGVVGAWTVVPDLVLAPAATVQGHVRWHDGEGIHHALVRTLPSEGVPLRVGHNATVQRDRSGALLPGATTSTDRSGAFQLVSVPGRTQTYEVERLHEMHLLTPVQSTAMPGQKLDLRLPRPVRIRMRHRGEPVPHAIVEIDGRGTLATNDAGFVDIVSTTALRLRSAHERLRSAWLDVPAEAAGTTLDLLLTEERIAVAIEFDGEFRVRNTEVQWRNDRGEQGRQHLARDDRSGPFQVFLEPGRYVLTAGPGGGERNGVFLLPVEREFEVATTALELRMPASFGGAFTLTATDSSGLHVGGTCRVYDAAGKDHSAAFTVSVDGVRRKGQPGELLPDATNHFTGSLPPGTYELAVEFPHHGAMPQRVTIRPREVAEVRLRLP